MPVDQHVTQVAYASMAVRPFTAAELSTLVALARQRNAELGVTGMLMYLSQSFFQVLEGPEELVLPLAERIAEDARHRDVERVLEQQVTGRTFPDWSMGLARLDGAELDALAGGDGYFSHGRSFFHLPPGRAKSMLLGFRDGRWQQYVA